MLDEATETTAIEFDSMASLLLIAFLDEKFSTSISQEQIKSIKSVSVIIDLIGEDNYGIITIPPKIWYSFKGISKKTSLILNIADSEHDVNDIKKINRDEFPLKINL